LRRFVRRLRTRADRRSGDRRGDGGHLSRGDRISGRPVVARRILRDGGSEVLGEWISRRPRADPAADLWIRGPAGARRRRRRGPRPWSPPAGGNQPVGLPGGQPCPGMARACTPQPPDPCPGGRRGRGLLGGVHGGDPGDTRRADAHADRRQRCSHRAEIRSRRRRHRSDGERNSLACKISGRRFGGSSGSGLWSAGGRGIRVRDAVGPTDPVGGRPRGRTAPGDRRLGGSGDGGRPGRRAGRPDRSRGGRGPGTSYRRSELAA